MPLPVLLGGQAGAHVAEPLNQATAQANQAKDFQQAGIAQSWHGRRGAD